MRKVFLLVFLTLLLSGCGTYTTRIAPKYDTEACKSLYDEGYRAGFKKGVRLGTQMTIYTLKKQIEKDLSLLASIREYQRLVKSGVLRPAQFALVRKGAKASRDGLSFEGSTFKVVITSPPRFVNGSTFLSNLLNPSQYYTVALFKTRIKARTFAQYLRENAVAEPDEVQVWNTDDGHYAIVIRSVTGKDYSSLGMSERIPGNPRSLSERIWPYDVDLQGGN